MDLSALVEMLKPMLAAEGKKLVDEILMPEISSIIEAKISDPVLKGLAEAMVPVIRAALDAEIAKLSA